MKLAPGPKRLWRWLSRRPVSLFLALAVGMFYCFATSVYSEKLRANLQWKRRVVEERETRLIGGIFEMAADQIRLRREAGSGRLLIEAPDCEDLMLPVNTEEERRQRGALALLCQSPQGGQVMAEIAQWNGSYNFVAVRDDRSHDETCDNAKLASGEGARSAAYVLPRGCKRNAWTAQIESGDDRIGVPWRAGGEPPLEDFAFLVSPSDPVTFEGDWALLSPASRDVAATYRLQTNLAQKGRAVAREVTIDVVGRVTGISIDGSAMEPVVTLDPTSSETHNIAGVTAKIDFDCNQHERNEIEPVDGDQTPVDTLAAVPPECPSDVAARFRTRNQPPATTHAQFVYQVRLLLPAGRVDRTVSVALQVESEPTIPESLRENRGSAPASALTDFGRGAAHLRVHCDKGWKAPGAWLAKCHLLWRRLEETEHAPPFRVVVGCETNLAEDVFDPDTGILKRDFFNLGFAPFVGYSRRDWGSLAWSLSQAAKSRRKAKPCETLPPLKLHAASESLAKNPPTVVPLTIDPKLQRIALTALQNEEANLPKCMSRRRSRASPAAVNAEAMAKCARHSRQSAALVILDDAEAPGAIRALASWPPLPAHLSEWDLRALESTDTSFAGFGWRAVGQDNVPGSTFKAVTATAAITALVAPGLFTGQDEDKATLAKLLRGEATRAQTVSFLGLTKAPFMWVAKGVGRWVDETGKPQGFCAPNAPATKGEAATDTIPISAGNSRPEYCPHNDDWEPFFNNKANARTHCPGNHSADSRMGMCEAVVISSNLFFGGLGHRLIDLVRPKAPSPLFPAPSLENILSATARRLSFGLDVFARPEDCGQSGDAEWVRPRATSAAFDLTRGVAPAPKLEASPVVIAASHPGCSSDKAPQLQAGFGLSVTATPLAIASIYASVARGLLVRPSLVDIPRDRGCPVDKADGECDPLTPGAEAEAADYFNILREGLHGVAGSQGTAPILLPEQTQLEKGAGERLFVKTGTATAGSFKGHDRLSLWVAGWIEGRADKAAAGERPVPKRRAFACVVTNQATGYGGSVCGPVIKELLKHLGEEGTPR